MSTPILPNPFHIYLAPPRYLWIEAAGQWHQFGHPEMETSWTNDPLSRPDGYGGETALGVHAFALQWYLLQNDLDNLIEKLNTVSGARRRVNIDFGGYRLNNNTQRAAVLRLWAAGQIMAGSPDNRVQVHWHFESAPLRPRVLLKLKGHIRWHPEMWLGDRIVNSVNPAATIEVASLLQ